MWSSILSSSLKFSCIINDHVKNDYTLKFEISVVFLLCNLITRNKLLKRKSLIYTHWIPFLVQAYSSVGTIIVIRLQPEVLQLQLEFKQKMACIHLYYNKDDTHINHEHTYFPNIGDVRKTMNSNIPKTSPYSVAVAPLRSAWSIRKKHEYINSWTYSCKWILQ